MKYHPLLALIFLGFFVSSLGYSGGRASFWYRANLTQSCSRQLTNAPINQTAEILTPQLRILLGKRHEQWLETRKLKPIAKNGFPDDFPPHEAKRFPHGFDIVALLGDGNEGNVYLVRVNGRLESLKVFNSANEMKENLRGLKKLHECGVSVLKIYEANEDARWVRFEYVKGIPLDKLNTVGKLSKEQSDLVMARYREKIESIWNRDSSGLPNATSFNAVYDIENDRIVVIDPR